ncbi:hypothetical protein AAFF_G00154860 [Aldrovandia affinis]|uniref:Uncharacterized protein n=1 Tax=Aldrovandia affinis TaxID=143900 RepID=A0AAD7SZZ9_9TELE|nr:hypothetical protein AAFF_G00154860 [Aldrovandia affinis]
MTRAAPTRLACVPNRLTHGSDQGGDSRLRARAPISAPDTRQRPAHFTGPLRGLSGETIRAPLKPNTKTTPPGIKESGAEGRPTHKTGCPEAAASASAGQTAACDLERHAPTRSDTRAAVLAAEENKQPGVRPRVQGGVASRSLFGLGRPRETTSPGLP